MENTIDITKLSVVELKALVYDRLNQREDIDRDIQMLNQQIIKLSTPVSTEEPKEVGGPQISTVKPK
jgi:hypothetical protein